jgi:ATP-dependent Clp protease ATP-binding subunit ClpB
VILLDEIEKAHPDVFNVLLQVLDDGRVTDSQGRTVDFKNTVIIMTSNIGSQYILDLAGDDSKYDEMKARVLEALGHNFRPEFLNRIDDTIIFHSLKKDQLRSIVKIQIARLETRLADRKLSLKLADSALDFLTNVGYDPVYGARPLKRTIQKELETILAKGILRGDFKEGDTVFVEVQNEHLAFSRLPATIVLQET